MSSVRAAAPCALVASLLLATAPATAEEPTTAPPAAAPAPSSASTSTVSVSVPSAAGLQDGPLVRARLGPALETRERTLGGWLSGALVYQGAHGLSVGAALGVTYLHASGGGLANVSGSAFFRVAALPKERFHPFGEIAGALHYGRDPSGRATGQRVMPGVHGGLGLEIELARDVSLDLGGRAEVVLVRASGESTLGVVLIPYAALGLAW